MWLVTRDRFGGEIAYSSSGVGHRNSYNESLSVDDDGTSLGLRALGMLAPFGESAERKLFTQEGAAEHLWTSFIEPLQRWWEK